MRAARLNRQPDIGPREINAAFRDHASGGGETRKPLLGQDEDIGGLTLLQPLKKPHGRREIGVNARTAQSQILCRERANRAGQSQRRQHPYRIFHSSISAVTAEASSTEIARPKRNDPPGRSPWRIMWEVEPNGAERRRQRALRDLLRRRLRASRNRSNRLQYLRSDLVGVALRVRTAVFQIALVAVVDERVRHADRSPAIGNAPAELVDRGRLVLAGQAQMVLRTVNRDVVLAVGFECLHQALEILLAAD